MAPVVVSVLERVVAPLTPKVPDKETESFRDKVADPPKLISPPPVKFVPAVTVILELVRAELGMLVMVLEEAFRVLLVKV